MNSKERFLAVINGKQPDRIPIFPLLMFLAADRASITYRQFATSGHAMAQAQLKMREMFAIDAITSCTDAFRVSADLGGQMVYPENNPPYLAKPLVHSEDDLKNLKRPDAWAKGSRMADRASGTREMARAVGDKCMVLGWVDMPFAEACSICGVTEFMMMLYDNPKLAHAILEFLTKIVIDFCQVQLEAGAAMIGAGDAAASLISPESYKQFALPYERRICDAVHNAGGLVKLHICGNTASLLNDMVLSEADLFNVDHNVDFQTACQAYSASEKCFKGNLDPVADMLQATPDFCRQRALECIRIAKGARYMLSAGCEIPADVSDEVFHAFCGSVS